MRIVLLGAPGAGKGTQAAILADSLNIPHISTGDLFRENISAKTELGKEAKDYIDAGKLVPSDVTGRMVEDRLGEDDTQNGFLLDGFPRSVEQAKMLESMLSKKDETLDAVVNYKVNEDVVVERMLARGRADDNEDTIRTRMGVYYDQTAPLIDYYADKVININAEGTVEEISSETLEELDR